MKPPLPDIYAARRLAGERWEIVARSDDPVARGLRRQILQPPKPRRIISLRCSVSARHARRR